MTSESISVSKQTNQIANLDIRSHEPPSPAPEPEAASTSTTIPQRHRYIQEEQQHSHFLDLPLHVRSMIYDLVTSNSFLEPDDFDSTWLSKSHINLDIGFSPPPLRQVNRQLRAECLARGKRSQMYLDFEFPGRVFYPSHPVRGPSSCTRRWMTSLPDTAMGQTIRLRFTVASILQGADAPVGGSVELDTEVGGGTYRRVWLEYYAYRGAWKHEFSEGRLVAPLHKIRDKDVVEDGNVTEEFVASTKVAGHEVYARCGNIGRELATVVGKEMERNGNVGIGMKELECMTRKMKELGCLRSSV